MNWFRENPFVAGLAAFTVVVTGALVFLVTQAMTQYAEVSDAYTQAVAKLQSLQNRSPFPNAENLEKTKALETQYKADLTSLQQQLSKLEAPLNPEVRPQQFQDDLRAAVNQVTEKASAAGVALPKDFYLGFGQYVNSPPTDRAAPALSRQLTVIRDLVTNLIDVKVQSIDNLVRRPLPEEQAAADRKAGIVERFIFDVSFTADQSKFRVIFNSLLKANRFLIVRGLNIANTSQEGPPVTQDAARPASESIPGIAGVTPTEAVGGGELNVLLGREQLKVGLRLEMIDFTIAEPEAKR
jgi:hypothetical protein